MNESIEVRDAVARFYDRLSAGDVEGTAATIADDPAAFVIGTQRIGDGREAWLDSVRENAEFGVAFEAGTFRLLHTARRRSSGASSMSPRPTSTQEHQRRRSVSPAWRPSDHWVLGHLDRHPSTARCD